MRLTLLLLSFSFLSASAQQDNLPLNRNASLLLESELAKKDVEIHTAMKPYLRSHLAEKVNYDMLYEINDCGEEKWLKRKIKSESFIVVDTANFQLYIDPVFDFVGGKDLEDPLDEKIYTNTRGVLVRGNIGEKVSFSTSFLENQSTFPTYIDDFVALYGVVPGQGRVKPFKLNGYDYARAAGYVSFSPKDFLNIQVGHGKHFVGDGYRSLLLSDFAFNYPYLKVTTNFSKFQYTNIYAVLMNLTDGGVATPQYTERLFQKKAASFQLLSWNLSRNIEWSFFQALVWRASDTKNQHDLNFFYYNPVIFGSLARYGLDDENNIVIGSNLKWKPFNRAVLYGQLMIDNGMQGGVQLGVKGYNVFKVENLNVQVELNSLKGMYQHDSLAQSYWHYNQPLGFANNPFNSGSSPEMILLLDYRWKRILLATQISYNTANITQGPFQYVSGELGYLINPATNLQFVVGANSRSLTMGTGTLKTRFVFAALRTALFNNYYDF